MSSSRSDYVSIPEGSLDDDIIKHGDDGLIDQEKAMKDWMSTTNDPPKDIKLTNDTIFVGVAYMLAMGVCGIVLVALGSSLEDLAENVGRDSTQVGTVFIARGIGAIMGAIFSAKLYQWFQGNYVMVATLAWLSILLITLPFNRNDVMLHVYFLFLGLGTAITDTGCQIMTRKVHGKAAGPWLGANTVSFGISGALVPVVQLFTDSLYIQYFALAAISLSVSFMILIGPDPEKYGRISNAPMRRPDGAEMKIPHYNVEIVIGLMVFCFIGGKVTSTAYFDTYVDDTGSIESTHETYLILVLWVAITIGRLAGVFDQMFLTNKTLPIHLSVFCVGGFLSMLLVLWFPQSAEALWIGVAFYGLFNGPCVGYCYDWNNRITHPTEASMSIVMFGLNFGASLVPYLTSLIWASGGGPTTLIVVIFLSMFLPLPLLHITKYLSYEPNVNPLLKYKYTTLPQSDPTEEEAATI